MTGMSISVSATGFGALHNRLLKMRHRAPIEAGNATKVMGDFYMQAVKTHASGRPGPNVITGAYRDSIHISDQNTSGDEPFVTVTTDSPQAARLEFGFVGIDSLGRHYHQPPFPHWRPALADAAAYMPAIMKAMVKGIVK